MRNRINLVLICCCATSAFARDEYKRDFAKTVPLADGRTFRIESSNGNMSIHTSVKNEVEIRAVIRCSASTADEARRFCDQIQIVVNQTGGVSVRTDYPKSWSHSNLGYGADYDVMMPEKALLDARNRFGNVSAINLRAGSVINNSNGRVFFSDGRGRLEIENSFGDVDVKTNDGDVTVRNGNGAVTAADVTGTAEINNRFGRVRVTNAGRGVTVRSNNGQIDVSGVGGGASIDNSFGAVIVTDVKGDATVRNQNGEIRANGVTGTADLHTSFARVNFSKVGKALIVRAANSTVIGDTVGESAVVETSFGGVDLRDIKGGAKVTSGNGSIRLSGIGGEVFAKTSFNGMTIADAAGPVTVESQNGSVTVETRQGPKCQPISVRTSFAPIRVTVPNGAGYNVTSRTSFARINSEHEMTVSGTVSPDSLTGKIGGGGCELRLMDQNGNIDILRSK